MRVALLGAGNMGTSLLRGWMRRGGIEVSVWDPLPRRREEAGRLGAKVAPSNPEAVQGADVVVLAVKPGKVGEVLDEVGSSLPDGGMLLSVAAGVPTAFLEGRLGRRYPVVRAMPNSPALVGVGISAVCPGRWASDEHLERAEALLGAVGEVVRTEEKLMDAVTGLSGSGPAYVYTFLEALVDGGVLVGLPRDLALKLALGTVLGAAKMAKETGEDLSSLRGKVTSPGGTTIAGLYALEKMRFRAAVMGAVEAATKRSEELRDELYSDS
ncbi:MAG: pyrroline-5-carboxylate reductase [Candidatus Latescibacterota bacterium]|nr:MAG: pyrroline-5-carboxylate reductase [Candidatus Latescibacterota bacterium]RKY73378.1 MAG: pyrroline-5-carboxylate reductase [Candidatus Latescibacterota bacterium]